jgi:hypothetical protein
MNGLGQIAAGGLSRIVLAAFVLALTAVAVTISGSGGFGAFGSLFGSTLHGGAGAETTAEPAAVAALVAAAAAPDPEGLSAPPVVRHRVAPRRGGAHRKVSPQRQPAASPTPAPAPAPSLPPTPPQPPQSGNAVRTVSDALREAAKPAPAAQPVVDQVVATVEGACGLIGRCP